VTDVTNAARTNFMELSSRTWHQPTLKLFGATSAMLPQIRSNAEVYGCVTESRRVGVCNTAHAAE
jgi:glycerol kinase